MNLLLSAVDVVGPRRWRWELRDEATAEVIAEHQVSLVDPLDSNRADAFGGLFEYVRWHVDPLWRDDEQLSHVFTERADLEAALGHADAAVRFVRSPLRMTYTRTIPVAIADAHYRLARYLGAVGGPPEEQQAHWLAAALLHRLSGEDRALGDLMFFEPRGLRVGLGPRRQPDTAGPPPRSLADLIDTAEQTSGVHLAELIAAIEPDEQVVIRGLTAILDSVAHQGPAAASLRAQGRQLFEELGGYELASNPGVVSLISRFRGWLGSTDSRTDR